ncbi:MAG: serine/threonine protein kinase [Chloroflexota bacterium]|nr:serine/threonine protein kinase [Chloroflexota bacterium]
MACGASLSGDPAGGYSSALPVGTQLHGARYAVGRVLGQGGFGITYLGSDSRARRPVAIKEFFPHGSVRHGRDVHPSGGAMTSADFNSARAKFLDEARVLTRFHHPGIVDVYDTFDGNNTAYMVMELLRGRSLLKLLEETGPVPEYETVEYATRAGEALEVVHGANLLHRDIKPDNIMLTDDGRVVLIDFGNARTFAAGKTGRMTTMLTPGYAPLEQYGQQVRFGPFTDVYALGATLYHLMTGQMPTDATDRATGTALTPPHELTPQVSMGVSEAIVWAMAIRIDERPQTAGAFVDALRTGLPATEMTPSRPQSRPSPTRPAPAPPRRPAPTPPAPQPDLEPEPPDLPLPPTYADEGASQGAGEGAVGAPIEVTVVGETLRWPGQCACCLETADASFMAEHTGGDGPFFLFEETHGWDVPYCSQCLEHVQLAAESPGPGFGRLAAGSLVGAALGGPIGLLVGLGGAAAASVFGASDHNARLQALLKPGCVALGPAVAYLGWDRDRHTFAFLNRDYAASFAHENAAGVVP